MTLTKAPSQVAFPTWPLFPPLPGGPRLNYPDSAQAVASSQFHQHFLRTHCQHCSWWATVVTYRGREGTQSSSSSRLHSRRCSWPMEGLDPQSVASVYSPSLGCFTLAVSLPSPVSLMDCGHVGRAHVFSSLPWNAVGNVGSDSA